MSEANHEPLEPPTIRAREASERALAVVEARGTRDQIRRVRLAMWGETPPPANHPAWGLFASEVMATFGEMVEELYKEVKPRPRGRPPKNRHDEKGETA